MKTLKKMLCCFFKYFQSVATKFFTLDYSLTKTKIKSGLQCHKKLWYDINDRLKDKSHVLELGNRFGDHIKTYYGSGVDLSGQFKSNILKLTLKAIDDPTVFVIYEAAFLYANTLVRADVLMRDGDKWKLIEVKSSTDLKNDHLKDVAIQAFVITNSNIKLSEVKIAHINSTFLYQGNHIYDGLIKEVNVDLQIADLIPQVQGWIDELLPVTQICSQMPKDSIGNQCIDEYKRKCIYLGRCENQTYLGKVKVPINIIPNIGNRLQQEWFNKGIYDLRDLPSNILNNEMHRQIQLCHQKNIEWINPELVNTINNYEWPRYFIDFETIQQGVPLIKNTTPYEGFPFQFSVHKWEFQDQVLTLEDSHSFLEFAEEGMDRRFLTSLIEILGDHGPIFTHNSSTEISALVRLAERESCLDLRPAVDNIIARTTDTLKMMRNGFYNPKMMGSFSLKKIVEVLNNADAYDNEGNSVGDGGSAMIKWYEYTKDGVATKQKEMIRKSLTRYCAQDTINLYHLFKYICSRN